MEFTAQEMELICFFHAGTRSATLAALRAAAEQMDIPGKKPAADSAVAKLSKMKPGEPVTLAFEAER